MRPILQRGCCYRSGASSGTPLPAARRRGYLPCSHYIRLSSTIKCTGAGFGKSSKKKVSTNTGVYVPVSKKKRVNIKEELSEGSANPVKVATPGSWKLIGDMDMFDANRVTKAVLLDNGKALMLFNIDGDVYCTDANSTAYQFPLSDAKVVKMENGPAIEVPFDGTVYDLTTGKVLKWCPNDGNMVRGLLHSLKKDSNPVNLKVYEVEVTEGGSIRVKL